MPGVHIRRFGEVKHLQYGQRSNTITSSQKNHASPPAAWCQAGQCFTPVTSMRT